MLIEQYKHTMALQQKVAQSSSMIGVILKVAAYTYGPLLGLFTFGILLKRNVQDRLVPLVCILSPLLCLVIDKTRKCFSALLRSDWSY